MMADTGRASAACRRVGLVLLVVMLMGCRRSAPSGRETPTKPPPGPVERQTGVSALTSARAAEEAAYLKRKEQQRAAARQAAAVLAGKLVTLRDANADGGAPNCRNFWTVGLRAVQAARARRGCVRGQAVECLQTDTGFFVPVDDENVPLCGWTLWYVPKREALRGPRQAQGLTQFAEADASYTRQLLLDDLTGDGLKDLVLFRGGGPENPVSIEFVQPTGKRDSLPFYDLRDVDGDGLLDGILASRDQDGETVHQGPTFVARRASAGEFALSDPVSKAQRKRACHPPLSPVVARSGRRVDESETLRRSLCSVADGADADRVTQEVRAACEPPACHGLYYSLGRFLVELTGAAPWRAPQE
jgi:hypothetical protein